MQTYKLRCTTTTDVRTFLENDDQDFAKILGNIRRILAIDDSATLAA